MRRSRKSVSCGGRDGDAFSGKKRGPPSDRAARHGICGQHQEMRKPERRRGAKGGRHFEHMSLIWGWCTLGFSSTCEPPRRDPRRYGACADRRNSLSLWSTAWKRSIPCTPLSIASGATCRAKKWLMVGLKISRRLERGMLDEQSGNPEST